MRTRFLMMMWVGLTFCQLPDAWAILPPAESPLPNYDKRTAAPTTLLTANVSSNAQQDAAVALLKSRLPNVRISKDSILGTPRMVAAPRGFLTGPGGSGRTISDAYLQAQPTGEPHRVIKAFLNEHSALFGHDAGALATARLERDYVTEHNGLHTTVWQQTLEDIPVFEGLLVGHVTRNDELVSLSSHFVPDVAKAADAGTPNHRSLLDRPKISAAQAVARAASNLGVELKENSVAGVKEAQGAEKQQTLQSENLLGPVSAQLVWLPMNRDSMRLCWRVILGVRSSPEHYLTLVDVETGEVLVRHGLTAHISPATYNVFTNDSPSPFSPGWSTPNTGQPPLTNRALVTLSALDTTASPNGWVADGPNPSTTGNNADAFLDRNLDFVPDVAQPSGGTSRVFNFPMDLTNQAPAGYASASTVQLFYRANWYHDRLYQLGFTEAAGNFQTTNFNRGGLGNDAVICLVQAGADVGYTDNSMFYTPPDGMNGYCFMFVFTGPTPNRDGSLDQEVVCHELTHGLSNRLVGGGVGISELQTEGMGEGWSDFYSLCLLSQSTDNVNACYAEGGYVSYLLGGYPFTENYYFGIRRYPYTTDMTKNPLTFKDIDPTQADPHIGVPINPLFGGGDPSEVHNQGEVWCVTLREVWASLVTKWGWGTGNELTLQLVTDGMKLAPANPTFLEARDAIIQADIVDTGGDNFSELWAAFAKRGMGYGSQCPTSDTTVGVVEAYDVPVPDGILEITVTPPSWSSFFTGETVPIYVRVTDVLPVTNATITATVSGSTNLIFRNDGVAPDQKTNDATYTALYYAPSVADTVTITLVISAPGKDTSTNFVTYYIVSPPPNDNFTNSTKVPVKGASYLTSNRRATLESGEPMHAGIASETNSLWWDYVPAVNTNVLVDTGGSGFKTVVAVYTNNTLATLHPVVSAVGSGSRPGAFLYIPGQAGVPYHIAVAGYDRNNVGTLRLDVEPVGQPDTNAPVVTITSPPSGIVVTTNRLYLTGSAVDQEPNPSGIQGITISVSQIPGNGEVTTTVVTPIPSLVGPLSTNWSVVVGLLPGLNQIQVVAADCVGNKSAPVAIQATYRVLNPANDFFANAIVLTNSAVSSVNTVNATKEMGEPDHAGNVGGKSVWWSFSTNVDGVFTLNTTNSTFDTLLALYTGPDVAHLTTIADNDDAYDHAPGGFSLINQAVKAGQTYHIAVDGYGGESGNAVLHCSFVPATLYLLTTGNSAGGTVQATTTNSMGGIAVLPAAAGYFASNSTVWLTAFPDAYYQFDGWNGDVLSTNNPLAIVIHSNVNITGCFSPVTFTDGFETGNLLHLPWTTAGNVPWFVTNGVVAAGQYAARSGVITNSQSSSLILAASFMAGTGSFDYRVSSETNWDIFSFYVDGVLQQQWSGEVGWATFSFPLTATNHTLEWRYTKDASMSDGLDAAFIDDVNLPIVGGPPQFGSFVSTNGTFRLTITSPINSTIIQASTNLINWVPVYTSTPPFTFTDTHASNYPCRFYRAVLGP